MRHDPRLNLTGEEQAPSISSGDTASVTTTLEPPASYRLEQDTAVEDQAHESRANRDDTPLGASIFAIGRRGELRWCTPAAQRDLKFANARHPRRKGRLSPEWAYHLWNPIHTHRLEYQIVPLDSDALPCRGRIAWSPTRPDELTVSIWRLRSPSDEADPTWRRLMSQLRGLEPQGPRPAA